jgi:antirestriction protein ArdC
MRIDRQGEAMTAPELQAQALDRARNGQALTNYPAIIAGFMEKGIQAADILPRENVFTFNAWKALGRSVMKGQHGVKVLTFVPIRSEQKDSATGEVTVKAYSRPKSTTVFHISQTEAIS